MREEKLFTMKIVGNWKIVEKTAKHSFTSVPTYSLFFFRVLPCSAWSTVGLTERLIEQTLIMIDGNDKHS